MSLNYFLVFVTQRVADYENTFLQLLGLTTEQLPKCNDLTSMEKMLRNTVAVIQVAARFHARPNSFSLLCEFPSFEGVDGVLTYPANSDAVLITNVMASALQAGGMQLHTLDTIESDEDLAEDVYRYLSVEPAEHAAECLIGDARALWQKLGDTPVNDDGELDASFLQFDVGTPREDIWDWFETVFNLSVHDDLMFRNTGA